MVQDSFVKGDGGPSVFHLVAEPRDLQLLAPHGYVIVGRVTILRPIRQAIASAEVERCFLKVLRLVKPDELEDQIRDFFQRPVF